MAMVGPELSSMFCLQTQQHQSSIPHQMMDWSSHGHGAGGMNHHEEVPSYVAQGGDLYHHPFSLSPQSSFDVTDCHQSEKTEPSYTSVSAEYDYMNGNPLSQVGSNHHHGFLAPSSTFMSTALNYDHQTSAVPGGVLEEIDGILRNFEMPPQHHHSLDMDSLFGDLISPQQGLYNGGLASVVQDHFGQMISVEDTQAVEDLAISLQVEIMSEHSRSVSAVDSCNMNSDDSPSAFTYASASQATMHSLPVNNGYLDAPTGRWQQHQSLKLQGSGQMLVKSPTPRQHTNSISSAALGASYHNVETPAFDYPRPPYGPNQPMAQHNSVQNNAAHQEQQHHCEGGRVQVNGQLGLSNPLPSPGSVMPATGLQLVHLLLACAEAVAENNLELAKVILVRLRGHVLPDGNPMQRLAAYFEQALRARLTRENTSPIFKGLTGDKSIPQTEVLEAFSVFYDCIPIGKFGHLTCNQILLDAVEGERMVHVVDLQIWHGMQWPAFLQALALRPGGPPKLRMSALGVNLKDLQETGEKLQECAKNLNVPFEFCPLITELVKFEPSMLNRRRGEVLVVNSFVQFHCLLNKGPDLLSRILRGLRALNPRVVAFAENDGNHNSPSFLTRFVECLRYYSAVFDAFDASLPADSPARMKMEQIFAAQKIRNIIACEGPARVDGHETMRYWHRRMESSNFQNVPLSSRAVSQANLLLNLYYSNGYTLNTSECRYLALGWHGMPLMGVSAWH